MDSAERIVKCSYSVYAVMFGTDETLLQIKLKDGFYFKKLSLIPHVSRLDKVFDTTDYGLRREFEAARIDENTLDVICAVKEEEKDIESSLLKIQFDEDVDKDLRSLDNQIRVIRFLKEGDLRFKKMAFHQDSKHEVEGMMLSCNHEEMIPIGEAMRTTSGTIFHCEQREAKEINNELLRRTLPLSDNMLNACHVYYDLSYHTELYVSLTLLMTALEILFLERMEQGKQKVLAKRCAVYLNSDEPYRIRAVFKQLNTLYEKRSAFVHEGKVASISVEDVVALREFVRKSLQKAMTFSEDKVQRVSRLKLFIKVNERLFVNENDN